jgi:hypothetical protein
MNTDTAIAMNITLDMPNDLSAKGKKAYAIIVEFLKAHELTDTGGCTAFYSPAAWRKCGEEYGKKSELIVVYDGGDLRPVFSMDAAYDLDCMIYQETGKPSTTPYSLYEGMQAKLRAAGFHVEECTGYYSAVYIA